MKQARIRRSWLAALVAGLVGAAAITVVPAAQAADRINVAQPTVTGPVTGGLKGGALSANPYDLAPFGYVEEEYFVSGMASRLLNGTWGTPAPYKTRVLVRRPADPDAFNGTAMLEWFNTTTGVGVPVDWFWYDAEVLRSGYLYVGVDAQAVGVAALRAYDPVRYADVVHPGDDYAKDILSQVALAFREPGPVDPTGGLDVERVLAGGSSQSCGQLNTYINDIHPIVEQVIDGFLPSVCSGTLRADLDVPVIRINSMNEASGTPAPDAHLYRLWEIAGASHSDKDWGAPTRRAGQRDWGDPTNTVPLIPGDYDRPGQQCLINRFPKKYAYRAGLDALNTWVISGVAAPTAPRIERVDGAIARDGLGNALGGLRLPASDVPTAAYNNGALGLDCEVLQGRTDPFSDAVLHQLYPTKDTYVSAIDAAVTAAQNSGYLLEADAQEIRGQATGFNWTYVWHGEEDPAALTPNPGGWLNEHT